MARKKEPTYTIASDSGNGTTATVVWNDADRCFAGSHIMPSVLGNIREPAEQDFGEYTDQRRVYEFEGLFYVAGDDVRQTDHVESFISMDSYGSDTRRKLTAVGLSEAGVSSHTHVSDLVKFAPLGLYADNKNRIQANYKSGLSFAVGGQNVRYNFDHVTVQRETFAAMFAIILDDTCQPSPDIGTLFQKRTALIDVGNLTTDVMLVNGFKVEQQWQREATDIDGGVNRVIVTSILDKLHEVPAYRSVKAFEVDRVIRRSREDGHMVLSSNNLPDDIDLTSLFRKAKNFYADMLLKSLLQDFADLQRNVQHVVLVGGAAWMVQERLAEHFQHRLLDPDTIPHLKHGQPFSNPVWWNAVGGLKRAVYQVQQQG